MRKSLLFSRPWLLLAVVTAILVAVGISGCASQSVEEAYPTKEITLICPYPPGGGADLTTRAVAPTMSELLGVNVKVENIEGADAQKGMLAAWQAPSDGYTIQLVNLPGNYLTAIMELNKEIGKSWIDLTWLQTLNFSDYTLWVKADSPYKSIEDLIKAPRVSFSASGGSSMYVTKLMINITKMNGTVVTGYGSSKDIMLAVARGDVDAVVSGLKTGLSMAKEGMVRPILYFTPNRTPEFPNMLTAREAGFPDLEVTMGYRGIAGPKGLSKDKAEKLNQVSQKALVAPTHVDACKKEGIPIATPKDLKTTDTEIRKLLTYWESKIDLLK